MGEGKWQRLWEMGTKSRTTEQWVAQVRGSPCAWCLAAGWDGQECLWCQFSAWEVHCGNSKCADWHKSCVVTTCSVWGSSVWNGIKEGAFSVWGKEVQCLGKRADCCTVVELCSLSLCSGLHL